MTTIKITQLTDIGANLATSTVLPVVNMAGTPTTQKTTVGNIANLALSQAGNSYPAAAQAVLAQTVTNAAQPNITSTGTLTNLTVSGNVAVNGNITSNGTAYVGNLSTTGLASVTTLTVGATANLGAVGNVTITGGTVGQVLTTNGSNVLSWTTVSGGSYGNSDVANYLPTFTGNIGANVVTANLFAGSGANLTNLAGANVSGTVGLATYATTANAVAGANVSGFVPNANVANTAFAVAAANVSGLGNIATINLDGNSSNVLRGDGTFSADANSSYGDSNVVSLLAAFGSNTISTTGIITADGANLSNVPYANLTGAPSLGNISSINLDGSNSNVLYGNGAFAAAPATAPAGSNGEIQFNISGAFASTGNLTFVDGVSGGTLEIGPPGAMQLDGNGTIVATNLSSAGNVFVSAGNGIVDLRATGNVVLKSDNANYEWVFGDDGILSFPGTPRIDTDADNFEVQAAEAISLEANTVVNIYTDSGNTTYQWQFGDDGNLTLPGNTLAINYANGDAAFGNIVSVNLDGNASNVLLGNGVFAGIPSPGELTANLDANTYSIANLGAIDFDTAANISVGQGQMAWNSSDGTLDIGLGYSDVVLQVGQETHYVVRNDSGNTILNGTAVYCSGVTTGSGRIEASPMIGNGSISPVQFLGLATQDITDGVNGVVTYFGYVRGLDTRGTANTAISVGDETWAVGDKLYVHPTANGKLTNVEPEAPNVKICTASVITRNQTSGILFVRPTTNLTATQLSDVQIDTPANGEVLQYVSANSRWENTSISSIANGNSNVSIATANGNVTINAVGNTTMTITGTGANVTGTLTSTGKIGYASGSTVTQLTSRGTGVTINALAGTIITTSAAMVATEIDTFSVVNSSVDPNNDIVLAQIVSPNQGTYDCIANPAVIGGFNDGFYINIVNISGFTTSDETITIRFMVIKAPNA